MCIIFSSQHFAFLTLFFISKISAKYADSSHLFETCRISSWLLADTFLRNRASLRSADNFFCKQWWHYLNLIPLFCWWLYFLLLGVWEFANGIELLMLQYWQFKRWPLIIASLGCLPHKCYTTIKPRIRSISSTDIRMSKFHELSRWKVSSGIFSVRDMDLGPVSYRIFYQTRQAISI